MRAVQKILEQLLSTNDKIVVVSQWANYLRLLKDALESFGLKMATLDGSVPVKFR